MYNGKFNRKRRLAWTKEIILLCTIVTLLLSVAGGTLAYLTQKTQNETNVFVAPEIDVTIPEDFTDGDTVKKNVKVKNLCEFDVFARATYVAYWQNDADEVYPAVPDLNITFGGHWTKRETDGYWYCDTILKAKTEDEDQTSNISPVFIESAQAAEEAPDGYHLVIDVIGEVIQSNPTTAAQDVWGYDPSES